MRVVCAVYLAAAAALTGCAKKEDPQERPGFVDTSDPSKVGGTMTPPPSQKASKSGPPSGKR